MTPADASRLHELLSLEPVYEFLSDGVVPQREAVDEWIAAAAAAQPPFGLWLLEEDEAELIGSVRLSVVEDASEAAELTYVVHPSRWGHGLASAMSRTAIARAFAGSTCELILAGADLANGRSVTVMQRLGMQYLRDVVYPAGPGVVYGLTRSDYAPQPTDENVPFT